MSIYRQSFLTEDNYAEFKELIESSFVFLNEDTSTDTLKKALDELKEKDVEKITKDDLEDIIKILKNVDMNNANKSYIISMISIIVSIILWTVGYAEAEAGDFKKSGIMVAAATLLSVITLNAPYTAYKSYDKIIKLEAKLNNSLKKLKALGEDADKQAIKELEKSIAIIKKIKVEYKNNYKRNYNEDVDLVLEFKGNENKTEAFKIILDEMNDICEYNLEKIRLIDKTIKEVESILLTKSTYKDLGVSINKLLEIDKGLDKKVSELSDEMGINYAVSGKVFSNSVKKFTTKYSEISMRDKEELAKKLTKITDKINEVMEYYNSKEFENKFKEVADFATINDKTGGRFEKGGAIYIGLLKYLAQEASLTKGDINNIIATLKIPKLRNSIIFKVLNPKF